MKDNKNVPHAIEKLAGCVFVQNVEFKALAIIAPILEKGLKNKITEIRRKSCVIIDNMCKLIEEPKEIIPLMPTLKPLVKSAYENIADPEARTIAGKALVTLNKTCNNNTEFIEKTSDDILQTIDESMQKLSIDKTIFNNDFS